MDLINYFFYTRAPNFRFEEHDSFILKKKEMKSSIKQQKKKN